MPVLEAPTHFDDESSPENSFAADLAVGNAVPATAQIRIHTADAQRIPIPRIVGNTFGGVRLPTIRLHTQRNLAQVQVQAAATANAPTANARPIRGGEIFAELEAEANLTLNWQGVGPAPPPVVNLLPVTLPPQVAEPQLDELLRRVTQRTDLQNVEMVRLRVISAITVSLSRLAMFLPRLQHLDLSGSVLCSLRDLGCGLIHLSHLNVSNCGLNSFDGTSGMPSVRTLIADSNMIQRVGPLTQLPLLQHLSAQNNRISDLGLLTFLAMCPNLNEMELQGNPVCHLPLYRHTLQRNVSTLRRIDGMPVGEHDADGDGVGVDVDAGDVDVASTCINNADEEHQQAARVAILNRRNALRCRTASNASTHSTSSFSSSASSIPNTASDNDALSSLSSDYQAAEDEPYEAPHSEINASSFISSATSPAAAARLSNSLFSLASIRQLRRPSTAPTSSNSHGQPFEAAMPHRPASASTIHRPAQPVLQAGAASSSIVAGSVLDLVRSNRRRRRNHRTAWMASSDSVGSSSSASSMASNSSLEPVAEVEALTNR